MQYVVSLTSLCALTSPGAHMLSCMQCVTPASLLHHIRVHIRVHIRALTFRLVVCVLQQASGGGGAQRELVRGGAAGVHQRGRGVALVPGEPAHRRHQGHDEHQRGRGQRQRPGAALRLLQGSPITGRRSLNTSQTFI